MFMFHSFRRICFTFQSFPRRLVWSMFCLKRWVGFFYDKTTIGFKGWKWLIRSLVSWKLTAGTWRWWFPISFFFCRDLASRCMLTFWGVIGCLCSHHLVNAHLGWGVYDWEFPSFLCQFSGRPLGILFKRCCCGFFWDQREKHSRNSLPFPNPGVVGTKTFKKTLVIFDDFDDVGK